MNESFRPATETDLPSLIALKDACIIAMRAQGIEQWDDVYPSAEVFTRDIAEETLWVVDSGGEIAGCWVLDQALDPLWADMDWQPVEAPIWAIHRLMVHPKWQGQGLAKRLMTHAESTTRMRGGSAIRLDAFISNPAALRLYDRLGYRRTGTALMRKGPFLGFEKLL